MRMTEEELIKEFEDYYAGLDWQEQQELLHKIDRKSELPTLAYEDW